MSARQVHAVTGALGFSGRHIARLLLAGGRRVRTLTNSPHRSNPFGGDLEIHPFNFHDPPALVRSLEGVAVLYNTYWVRFNHKRFTRSEAVTNTLTLFECARTAGVERIVHVSVTNPSEDSPLEYFRSKAHLETALKGSGVSHAILRPAVLFGTDDILINNIAWTLRRFPVFGLFGDGAYRIRPIHVEDLARLAVEHGGGRNDVTVNAVGPESFSYRDLVAELAAVIGKRRPIVALPPSLAYGIARVVGALVGDVVLTRDEIQGLMAGLLDVDTPASGPTRLTAWARDHADTLGRRYASELARRRERAPGAQIRS